MIRIIDHSNSAKHADALKQQFANRHTVFVKEMGWTQFEIAPGVEKDVYDNEHAVYAVLLNVGGDAIGGLRFYPTMLPHMLSDAFPHLVDGPCIARPDVFEVTRFHVLPAYRCRETFLEILVAIQEVGMHLGCTGLTALVRTLRLPVALETGLSVRPLGEPALVDGVSSIAVYYEVHERILRRMNQRRGTDASVVEGGISRSGQFVA